MPGWNVLDVRTISDDIRSFNEKLREWQDYYNYHRPHGALGDHTPHERLLARARAKCSDLNVALQSESQ